MKIQITYSPNLAEIGDVRDVDPTEARILIKASRAVAVDENAPDPVADLIKAHRKDDLLTMAADRGIEVDEKDAKAVVAAAIVAATSGD